MKLSKRGKIVIGCILLVILIFGLVSLIVNSKDGAKFKKEYESLNGKEAYGDAKYQSLKIKKNNKIKYSSMDEVVNLIFNEESALVYFGYARCPWCRGMIETMLETVGKSKLKDIYYVDMTDKRDTYSVVDGEAKRTKEATNEYYALLSLFDEYLDEYVITDEDGIEVPTGEKRIMVPFVAAIKDGKVVMAQNAVVDLDEGQSPYDELDAKQKSELSVIFTNMIDATLGEGEACTGLC